ncbi:hypothetical protein [Micromonospora sp. BL4]|uniref:hypothetical protein n=1 Tax=Micromonospora sp. BL4 TaxID=2478710 RepID=UPI0034CD5370
MRGRQHDGVRVGLFQLLDENAVRPDRDADHLQAGGSRDGADVVVRGWVLDGQPAGAARRQHLEQQRDALAIATADHDVLPAGQRAAGPVEVIGEDHILEQLDPWLARAFSPSRLTATVHAMAEAQHDDADHQAIKAARKPSPPAPPG